MFNKNVVVEQSKYYDSFYLYDEKIINKYIKRLKNSFSNVKFLYSIKANSHPLVVKCVTSQGIGVDASSINEVKMGKINGVSKDKIQYSAPGKTKKNIEEAINDSIIIADSINEIGIIQQVAHEINKVVEIGIRINPEFSFYGIEGVPSKFGIDEKLLFNMIPFLKKQENIKIRGLHIHLRSQELNADVLENYYAKQLVLAERFQNIYGEVLTFINLGSGIGIPFASDDKEVDTEYLGKKTVNMINDFKLKFPNINIYIETGRYVVGKSGIYVTTVLDKKISYGKKFVILKNTLNGFLKPSKMATFISSFVTRSPYGIGLGMPETMEMAIRECGLPKILL
ncbi:diaminopimelate decarboxylase, partial [Clostridiaceae bacterium HSG29]|nr:diaminopimelate decarboxylase [Clostridiaceae bacterium HSG29]